MSDPDQVPAEHTEVRTFQRFDAVCEAFASQWRAGKRPAIKTHLAAAECDRALLLVELLAMDIDHRRKLGEQPTAGDYTVALPEYEAEIRRVFQDSAGRSGDHQPTGNARDDTSAHPWETAQYWPAEAPDTIGPNDVAAESSRLDLVTEGIPGYEFIELLGRGGMGVVYRARQIELNREVAIKLILAGRFASPEQLLRFRIEAETVAAIEHANIVHVYDAGEHDSQPYLVMEFVAGDSLDTRMQKGAIAYGDAAVLIEALSRGIHAAHLRGIVHRDLKPANILLTADNIPKITDFGLAKKFTEDTGRTQSGALLGTPGYMAPEQASGDAKLIGPAADIYALGAILYEMLARRPLFEADSLFNLLEAVKNRDPAPMRKFRRDVPSDLETICRKCLAKNPAHRYASAEHLADDLLRYQQRRPIRARKVGSLERMALWARRRPGIAGLLTTVAALGLLMLAGGVWYHLQLRAEHDRAERRFQLASHAVDEILTVVGEQQLIDEPGTQQRRQALLERALEFCQTLTAENPADFAARRQLGFAHRRTGDVQRMLGKFTEAEASYAQAIRFLGGVANQLPSDDEVIRQLASAHNFLGELFRTLGRDDDARTAYDEARQLQVKLVGRQTNPDCIAELARTYYNLGLLEKHADKLEMALSRFDDAEHLLEGLLKTPAATDKHRQHMVRVNLNRGSVLRLLKRNDDAATNYEAAIAAIKLLVKAQPRNTEFQFELALAQNNHGNLLSQTDLEAAAEQLGAARASLTPLAQDYPLVPVYGQELANACNGLATVLAAQGALDQADAAWSEAVESLEHLLQSADRPATTRADLGMCLGNLGRLQLMQDDLPRAESFLQRALREMASVLQSQPSHPSYRQAALNQCVDLAKVLMRQQRYDEALNEAAALADAFDQPLVSKLASLAFLDRCLRFVAAAEDLSPSQREMWRTTYAAAALPQFTEALADEDLAAIVQAGSQFAKLRQIADPAQPTTKQTP